MRHKNRGYPDTPTASMPISSPSVIGDKSQLQKWRLRISTSQNINHFELGDEHARQIERKKGENVEP